jgi:hypothetical protein
MFSARQEMGEGVASWGSRIDEMQTKLRKAAKRVCKPEELLGAIRLINHLGKACFVQVLHNERIQTIARSRGESILLSQAVEISLEEDGAISMRKKSAAGGNTVICTNYNRLGHLASKCNRSGFPLPTARAVSIVSFKCGRAGHVARFCRRESSSDFCGPTANAVVSRQETTLDTRRQGGLSEAACGVQRGRIREENGSQGPTSSQSRSEEAIGCNTFCKVENEGHTFNAIQCESQENSELNTFCRDENEGRKFSINQCESHGKSDLDTITLYIDSWDSRKLKFLIDTGAEISIIRSSNLTPEVEYQWHEEIEIKVISNTVVKTLGKIDLKLFTDKHKTTHTPSMF